MRPRLVPPLLLAAALLAVGCGGDDAEPGRAPGASADLPTEDVAPPLDAGAVVSADAQERAAPSAGVAGVLPPGFPADLPLPPGASVVDFGDAPGGAFVVLGVPASASAAAAQVRNAVAGAGWSVAATGPAAWTASRRGRTVRLAVTAAGPLARLRVEYPQGR